ncbi:MAG: sulfite exporter TauE/SafE family protein [Planctomycetes bacterium]|nr:sulfite exporter TauE/SafE family protein [Planctomycetota bacterium]
MGKVIITLCILCVFVVNPLDVNAHDITDRQVEGIGNSVQIGIWPDLIYVDYWIAIGTIESINYFPRIDVDSDGIISAEEKLDFLKQTQKKVIPTALALAIGTEIGGSTDIDLTLNKSDIIITEKSSAVPIKINFEFLIDATRLKLSGGPRQLSFFVTNILDKKILLKIFVAQSEEIDIDWTPDDFRHIQGLRSGVYLKPAEGNWVRFSYQPVLVSAGVKKTPPPLSFTGPAGASDSARKGMSGFLATETFSLGVIITALIISFLYGAGHALTPGHGKTLVAAYLVGRRGSVIQAILLGLVVTFTHIFTVILAGIIAYKLSGRIHQSELSIYLGVISGIIVIVIGVTLFVSRLKGLSHNHDHHHGHNHEHHIGGDTEPVTLMHLLSLGISGGLVPCPTAIVILLMAISLNKTIWGLILILAFSVGLASVLVTIGILMVTGTSLLDKFTKGGRVFRTLAVISPVLIIFIGFGIIFKTLIDIGVIIINTQALP